MTGSTHTAGGLAVGMLMVVGMASLPAAQGATVIGCAALGGLLPDIDLQTSKIGSRLKPASVLIQTLFGHRTLFHSPVLYLAMWFLAYTLRPDLLLYSTAILAGVGSHLFLDMLNKKGIPLLYPYKKRFSIAGFALSGLGEHTIKGLLIVCIVYAASKLAQRGFL